MNTTFKHLPIEGIEDYSISRNGVIVNNAGRRVKSYPNRDGYLGVILRGRYHSIHRLVALTYLPNPDGLPQVNHKNEIKSDNRLCNLEWCDHLYNCRYGTGAQRSAAKRGKMIKCSNGIQYPSISEAARQTKVTKWDIFHVLIGRTKTVKGLRFRYV